MANPLRKPQLRKDYDHMDKGYSLLEATHRMDLNQVRLCLQQNPESIKEVDLDKNNAMHLCVLGGAAIRAREMMLFFLEETEIDLLQPNQRDLNPFELALALNDRAAIDLIGPYAHEQLDRRFPIDDEPTLTVVPGGTASGADPSP